MTDEHIYISTGTPYPAVYYAYKEYLEANKDYLAIVVGRTFYAGCKCECCSAKKRPKPDVKCVCGIH